MSKVIAGDPAIVSLLDILSKPDAYKRQLEDYAKERKAYDEARAKLTEAQTKLEETQRAHQNQLAEHNARVSAFQTEKDRILGIDAQLEKRAVEIARREADLKHDAKVHAQAVDDWDREYDAKRGELAMREKAVADLEKKLSALQADLAAKEKQLSTKLDRLKEIVG